MSSSQQSNSERFLSMLQSRLYSSLASQVAEAIFGENAQPSGTITFDDQTISFQAPEDPGEDPFTPPADVEGSETVEVQQPFGGSGSNRVCDRDKLIKFLEANPERMAEWARVLGLEPRISVVKKYIAKLHPVTLTRDTQVTNHAYTNGQAVPFQAILQAGTAVLVDGYGVPVVRCYCGNPLGPAGHTPEAKCTGCPPDYKPPKQCEYTRKESYDKTVYRRNYYSNGDYDEVFISRHRSSGSWAGHTVFCIDEFDPEVGHQEDTSVVPAHRGHRLGLLRGIRSRNDIALRILAVQLVIIVLGLFLVLDVTQLTEQVDLGTTPEWDELLFALTLATAVPVLITFGMGGSLFLLTQHMQFVLGVPGAAGARPELEHHGAVGGVEQLRELVGRFSYETTRS